MVCMNPTEPKAMPRISLDKLQKAIPVFDWSKGHLGVLLHVCEASRFAISLSAIKR